jgi:hypothetical protein
MSSDRAVLPAVRGTVPREASLFIGSVLLLSACGARVLECTEYHEPDFACDLGDANGTCLEWAFDRGQEVDPEAVCNTEGLATVVPACPHVETAPIGAGRGIGGCTGRVQDIGCITEWLDGDVFSAEYRTQCVDQGNTPLALCDGEPCAAP